MTLSRRTLWGGAVVLAALALFFALPYLSPSRGLERAWDDLLTAIEDKDAEALERRMAANYRDGFGFDRAGAIEAMIKVRGQFVVCRLRREKSELALDPSGKSAITRALMRLSGNGSPAAQGAIHASQASETPTSFRWRRETWKPWDWQLVGLDNPDAARAYARFEAEAARLGLSL
jgi:hypothetical protein